MYNILCDFSIVVGNSDYRFLPVLAIAFRDNLGVVLIYRKNNSNLSSFYEKLEILNGNITLNFIIEHFNLDAFSHEAFIRLSNISSNFGLLSNKSSHLNGTHFDQVYVRKAMFQEST